LPPVGGTVAFTVTTNLTEAELDVTYPSWIKKEVDTRAATIEIPYKIGDIQFRFRQIGSDSKSDCSTYRRQSKSERRY